MNLIMAFCPKTICTYPIREETQRYQPINCATIGSRSYTKHQTVIQRKNRTLYVDIRKFIKKFVLTFSYSFYHLESDFKSALKKMILRLSPIGCTSHGLQWATHAYNDPGRRSELFWMTDSFTKVKYL